jgi:hypothetical protein
MADGLQETVCWNVVVIVPLKQEVTLGIFVTESHFVLTITSVKLLYVK